MPDVRIPLAPLVPHLRRYVLEHDEKITANQFNGGVPPISTVRVLAAEVGIDESTLRKIVTGKGYQPKTIEFNTADKLLCMMNQPMLWYQDRKLKKIYLSVDLSSGVRCARRWTELNAA